MAGGNGDMDISSFHGQYRWLSNFASVVVMYDDCWYTSVEHAYQAAKTTDSNERQLIQKCLTPGAAKKAGRCITIRPDWEQVKKDVMLALLRQKFSQQPYKERLIETGNSNLVEGNEWGDTYWGVCHGVGQNMLGQLLMQVRGELTLPQSP